MVRDYLVEVEPEVNVGCKFYTHRPESALMLYFHGNGEIVDDYDSVAPFFNQIGINLFVASYRGYGFGNGTPTLTNMIKDAHEILKEFRNIAKEYGCGRDPFIMGRSLGSLSAIELALSNKVQGLIVESGLANSLSQYLQGIVPPSFPIWNDDWEFHSKVRIRSISKPTLIIHGEIDDLIPLEEARELHDRSGARDKQLEIIHGCGHNDLFSMGKEAYFKAIEKFVKKYGPA